MAAEKSRSISVSEIAAALLPDRNCLGPARQCPQHNGHGPGHSWACLTAVAGRGRDPDGPGPGGVRDNAMNARLRQLIADSGLDRQV